MPHPLLHIWAHPRDWSLQPLYLSTLFYNLFVHTYKFTNLGTMQPLCPTISEVFHLQLPCMHLYHPLHWKPQLTRGQMTWGVAISCGIRIRLRVIEGEMFLLFHGHPPISQSLLPTWFQLSIPFTLLKLCICRWGLRVHFLPFLFFLQFFFLLFLILLL